MDAETREIFNKLVCDFTKLNHNIVLQMVSDCKGDVVLLRELRENLLALHAIRQSGGAFK